MNLKEFKRAFAKLKKQGWIKSRRRGPTGVSHTLEQLTGLKENNISSPDLGDVELKAHRINSSSMITLFTFNRKVWKMKPLEAVRNYGTPDKNGRLGLYFTMSLKPNSTGLFLLVEHETISVRHISGKVVAEWQLDKLAKQFAKKVPALLLVSAFSEMRGDDEWFKYDRARLLTGTSPDIIRNQIEAENVVFDLRLQAKSSKDETRFVMNDRYYIHLFKNCAEFYGEN
jgi:hypothetical protein